MSYRPPLSGTYPTDLSPYDYNALTQIWGISDSLSPVSRAHQSVYRLFNTVSGNHLFTTNTAEIDLLTGSGHESSFINEGIAYLVSPGANQSLYRFYHSPTDRHFYSSNSYERDLLISKSNNDYLYEGVAFHVFTDVPLDSDLTPVFRFYDSKSHVHLYTASSQEKLIWESNGMNWINEGIAWYA